MCSICLRSLQLTLQFFPRRYCPSLETKFKRFPGRMQYVWLEPEGLDSHVLYPNGLSNSLEPEDQIELLRTVPGDSPQSLRSKCVDSGAELYM